MQRTPKSPVTLLLTSTLLLSNFPMKVSPVLTSLSLMSGAKYLSSMRTAMSASPSSVAVKFYCATSKSKFSQSHFSTAGAQKGSSPIVRPWDSGDRLELCLPVNWDPFQQHHLLMPMQSLSSPSNQNKITGILIWASETWLLASFTVSIKYTNIT